jgi:hypothetical protein
LRRHEEADRGSAGVVSTFREFSKRGNVALAIFVQIGTVGTIEPGPFNGLNGAQWLTGLNVLNGCSIRSETSLRVLPAFAGFVTFLITALLSFFVAILIVFLLGLLISLSVPVGVSTIVCFGGRWWG